MTAIEILHALATGYVAIWALYLLLLPLLAGRFMLSDSVRQGRMDGGWPTLAVIVPAHNVAAVIAQCIRSLHACHYSQEQVEIYVVADHCSDDTAEQARAAGATVLTRDDGIRGKTYALAWAFEALTDRGVTPDAYLIVDATVQVEGHFLTAMAERCFQGEDIVTSHLIVSEDNQKWYARCLGLMLVHRNLQSWSRERLGLSAMLDGRGMAYSRRYIERFGWHLALPTGLHAAHPTEDWRHGVRAAEQGYRVAFADNALVLTPLRHSMTEATKQGIRWERGRMINATTHAFRLLLHGLQRRHLLPVCAALDAMQPPVAILGALSLVVAASTALAPGAGLRNLVSFVPLLLVGAYGLVVIARGRHEGISVKTAIWGPLYIVWRCTSFVLAWGFFDRIHFGWPRRETD